MLELIADEYYEPTKVTWSLFESLFQLLYMGGTRKRVLDFKAGIHQLVKDHEATFIALNMTLYTPHLNLFERFIEVGGNLVPARDRSRSRSALSPQVNAKPPGILESATAERTGVHVLLHLCIGQIAVAVGYDFFFCSVSHLVMDWTVHN